MKHTVAFVKLTLLQVILVFLIFEIVCSNCLFIQGYEFDFLSFKSFPSGNSIGNLDL